jgi:hypothetical protein
VPVIIWINGGFGAGKTTLARELHRRLPDAVVYNPEDVGLMLWKWVRPNGDFQHLPSWWELVVATALSLRRHHADTLIVPMSLIRGAYTSDSPRSLRIIWASRWPTSPAWPPRDRAAGPPGPSPALRPGQAGHGGQAGPMTRPRKEGEAIRGRNACERRRFARNEKPTRGRRDP